MIRDDIELGLKVVATLIALFGVGKYFYDRAEAVQAEHNARSLSFIASYASADMLEPRDTLFRFWKANAEYLAYIRIEGTTPRTYRLFARAVLEEYDQARELQGALFRIANFYDQLWHCQEAGLCAESIINKYFCPRVRLEAVAYEPFYEVLRDDTGFDDFGSPLLKLREQCDAL